MVCVELYPAGRQPVLNSLSHILLTIAAEACARTVQEFL